MSATAGKSEEETIREKGKKVDTTSLKLSQERFERGKFFRVELNDKNVQKAAELQEAKKLAIKIGKDTLMIKCDSIEVVKEIRKGFKSAPRARRNENVLETIFKQLARYTGNGQKRNSKN